MKQQHQGILAALAVAGVLAGCSSGGGESSADHGRPVAAVAVSARPSPAAPPDEPVVLRVSTFLPQSLVPADVNGPEADNLLAALFSPLVRVAAGGVLEPLVAAALPTSGDGTTWTVTVAPGWTFHNGEAVTASSFVDAWNFAAMSDRYFGSFPMNVIAGYNVDGPTTEPLSGLRVLDPMTIQIALKVADPNFPVALADLEFAPVSQQCLAAPDACEASPIGNGPFQVTSAWVSPGPVLLERFDNWNGPAPAVADRVEISFRANPAETLAAVSTGELDLATMSAEALDPPVGAVITSAPLPGVQTVAFAAGDERFDDVRVRRAFSMAVDREALARTAGGFPAASLAPPTLVGQQPDACGSACRYDPAAARSLLAAAGGVAGPVTLTFGGDYQGDVFELLADQLETGLGVEIVMHDSDKDEVQVFGDTHAAEGLYASSVYGERPTAAWMVDQWRSDVDRFGEIGNGLGYSNDTVDSLLARAGATTEPAANAALVREAERAVLADLPAAPLYFRAMSWAASSRLSGLETTMYGGPRWELLDPG